MGNPFEHCALKLIARQISGSSLMWSGALFISGHMSLLKDITSFYCFLLCNHCLTSCFWYSFKNVSMALTILLCFFLEVFHHVHKEMLYLAFKVLSLESVINLSLKVNSRSCSSSKRLLIGHYIMVFIITCNSAWLHNLRAFLLMWSKWHC